MGKLYGQYPDDVDAGAFYALSLLAAEPPNDTSLTAEHKAMAVLTPLFAKYPDNPGVVHYIIHSCDNPAMASEGLAASDHYGEIAPAGAHAVHMPGHIYARLGMWPQDVASQLASITAAENAEKRGEGGIMDEPHSYDFVTYAYIQSGQDAHSKDAMNDLSAVLTRIQAMPNNMANTHMEGMVPYYRAKLPTFYALEMRDWKSAAALEPWAGAPPEIATMSYWARSIGAGHLRQPEQAQADLAKYDALITEVKKGKHAYYAEGTGTQIERNEIVAWVAFAAGKQDDALKHMREAADLQDKVGQAEVDIPGREMLGDMLLDLHQPQQALAEYEISLKLSPNRFNGLYHAGLAAEEAGDKAKAQQFYAALLKSTDNGAQSARPEFAHVKNFVSSTQLAVK
jgi:tetratricopeptide (TPR) repeat protein